MPNAFFGCVFAVTFHFSLFLKGLESCEALFEDLGTLVYHCEGRASLKGYGSRDQVGCLRSLQEEQIQRTKIQGSAPAGRRCRGGCTIATDLTAA